MELSTHTTIRLDEYDVFSALRATPTEIVLTTGFQGVTIHIPRTAENAEVFRRAVDLFQDEPAEAQS